MAAGNVFQSVDELGDKPLGWVPFFAFGTKQTEFAETFGIPFEATQGGAEKTYPEYQIRLQQLIREEAAKRTMLFENAAGSIKHTTMTTTTAAFPDNYQIAYTSKLDGQDAPVTGTAFDTYALKRIDARTIERTAKIKGQVLETVTYVVSPDGQLLTVREQLGRVKASLADSPLARP